jgi:quercetin dioxygenase-like cupin family protein
MALEHAKPAQVIALTRAGEDTSTFSSLALTKTKQIELIRLVLPAGKEMPEHHVNGEITFQCLSGEIAFTTRGVPATLKGGDMLYLEGGAPHALRAVADSVALLTIVLRNEL